MIVISLNPLYTSCNPSIYSGAEVLPLTKFSTNWPLDLAFGWLFNSNIFNKTANLPRIFNANQVPFVIDCKSRPIDQKKKCTVIILVLINIAIIAP